MVTINTASAHLYRHNSLQQSKTTHISLKLSNVFRQRFTGKFVEESGREMACFPSEHNKITTSHVMLKVGNLGWNNISVLNYCKTLSSCCCSEIFLACTHPLLFSVNQAVSKSFSHKLVWLGLCARKLAFSFSSISCYNKRYISLQTFHQWKLKYLWLKAPFSLWQRQMSNSEGWKEPSVGHSTSWWALMEKKS